MLNEEEKKAIERLKERINDNEDYKTVQIWLTDDVVAANIVLNLITKLQKENEEKDKQIEQYLNKRIKDVEKCYNEMLTDIGGIKIINITGLIKKEKEEVINKRNCLLVQKQCYQEILEKLAKKKGE